MAREDEDTIEVRIPRSALRVVIPPPSRWMQAKESPLGISKIRALVKEHEIPASRPGKHLLIDREAHDAWIDKHRVHSTPVPTEDETAIAALLGLERKR